MRYVKTKWHKVVYLFGATILVLGLTMVPATVGADNGVGIGTFDADPTTSLTPLDVEFTVELVPADYPPFTYEFTWNYEYRQNEEEEDTWKDGDHSDYDLLFDGELQEETVGPTNDDKIKVSHTFDIPGWYNVRLVVEDDDGNTSSETITINTLGIIPPDIAYDVKGAQHKICVKGMELTLVEDIAGVFVNATAIDWWLVAGVELDPDDIIVKVPGEGDPETWDKVKWDPAVVSWDPGDPEVEGDVVSGQACIHIEAMQRGDIHVYARVFTDAHGGDSVTLHTEKKWGELDHTILDLDADEDGIQGPSVYIQVDPTEMGEIEEVIEDTVYAIFEEVTGPRTVGHAIVHWWLFEDANLLDLLDEAEDALDEAIDDDDVALQEELEDIIEVLEDLIDLGYSDTQELINDLMDHLASQDDPLTPELEGWVDEDYWQAAGKYNTEWLFDWMEDLGYEDSTTDMQPYDAIDFLAKDVADKGLGLHADSAIFEWDESNDWYHQNVTPDSWPTEDRGVVQATLVTDAAKLEECQPENVMIVVLVSYPGGDDPTDDPFNGQNMVVIEKGKKQFHKTKIVQVKTPQLRWAGEKIVLEKDWGVSPEMRGMEKWQRGPGGIDYYMLDATLYFAIYSLEEGSIGDLEPIMDIEGISINMGRGPWGGGVAFIDYASIGLPMGAQQVIAPLGGGYYEFWWRDHGHGGSYMGFEGDSETQVIHVTEQQGEGDVNAALYQVDLVIFSVDGHHWFFAVELFRVKGPINDHGFLTYFLAFEDVVLAEDVPLDLVALAGDPIDVTPLSGLQNLDPIVDDADVAVQVRGWFTSDAMPGTNREAVVSDDGITLLLPAGRYVLPNDWPAMADYNYALRPNWDLMDEADLDDIISIDDKLGPYDVAVESAGVGGAEEPNIGPFNTLQQWSVDDLWIADATTVPTSHPDYDWRNTVVPDGELNWLDAPMPQALVLFDIDIVSSSTAMDEIPALSGLDKGVLEGYGVENGPQVDPLGLVDDEFQSPFYAVEIPSNMYIPGGYNWNSWGTDEPYDYWTDLALDSIIADTPEDPEDPDDTNTLDVEVYSDNHGIAAVTIDALEQAGRVTITATAEYPYAPKKGKYGPRTSDDITVIWGAVELDPHFLADETDIAEGGYVNFTNETEGGTHPYTDAWWDFGDGSDVRHLTGTEAVVMAVVDHQYNVPGTYHVRLTMKDSTPTIRFEERLSYITVGGVTAITWNMPIGGETLIAPNPGAGRPFLTVAADCDDITVSAGAELWGIYYLDETVPGGEWLYYIPGFVANTLTLLEPDDYYYVVVSAPCTLTIPQGT